MRALHARRSHATPTWQPAALTSTTAAAERYLPMALVDGRARTRLRRVTDCLPAALTRRVYFECRLAEDARVDVVLCVDASSRTQLIEPRSAWLPDDLRAHPLWQGLDSLSSVWGRAKVGARILDVWLEFDAEDEPVGERHPLVPGIFVGLARTVVTPPRLLLDSGLDCITVAVQRPVRQSIAAAARDVVAHLPVAASLPYIGLMYPRDAERLRLCVAPLSGDRLLDYLRRIRWPGSTAELAAFLQRIRRGLGTTALDSTTLLHIDVLDGVQPRIGLEIPLRQHPQVIDGSADRTLFDALCAGGLCAPAKRDALMQWPGHSIERFAHQCWPSLALRRISHVKVIYEPHRAPEIKTYLSYFHDAWRRRPAATVVPQA